REAFASLTRLCGLFGCGLVGLAGCWLRLIRQVVEQQESLRIRLGSGLDERVRYSQFAQLLWPEDQSRLGAAVVRIEHPQVNQSRAWLPICRPMRVVDGHYAVVHGFTSRCHSRI